MWGSLSLLSFQSAILFIDFRMFILIVFLGDAAAVSPELWPAPHVVITDMVRIYYGAAPGSIEVM